MKVFLDTSAFAKRYVAEQGSDKLMALCQQADSLAVSVIYLPELISTLSRLVREKKLTKAGYRKLKSEAMADLADVDICQITSSVMVSVISLLESHSLRAMDALHLACALAVEPDFFVSADHRQLSAARKAGLKIVDVS
ncbi:MAG: type II toxin-antitoxin system VapC family toxin [Betaproteobacteria bacterium]|nr:type II toxin-antitoxin system VapC family toxin [Betaproteobacteria bacterium]